MYSSYFLLGPLVCPFLLFVNCVKLENFTVLQDKRRVGGKSPGNNKRKKMWRRKT
jgi:hypothetical protein